MGIAGTPVSREQLHRIAKGIRKKKLPTTQYIDCVVGILRMLIVTKLCI